MLPPRHLIFTSIDGALLDARGDSGQSEQAIVELDRRKLPWILVTARTRAEVEPVRREIGHTHPFVTESGGAIFFPDGYLNIKIPNVRRVARYLAVVQGLPYEDVCVALDDMAAEVGVGVAGFHHMNAREIADNTGLRPRDAELARAREFDEPFYFTSADEKAIARFSELATERGFALRQQGAFWHLSKGCDAAQAVRLLSKLFRDATRIKLRVVGIASAAENPAWLRATDQPIKLGGGGKQRPGSLQREEDDDHNATTWSEAIISIIG